MLTIVSVSYKSKPFLEMNWKLVKALNPGISFRWIIVQNTPEDQLSADLAMDDPRFQMIKGPSLSVPEKECSFNRSIHHAKALNLALSYTEADHILILDPDCFILRPNWISQVLEHMEREKIVFFGSPYHPKYYTHYREFPNAICMFIHRRLMQEKNYFALDFMPVFEGKRLLNRAQLNAIQHHSQPKHLLTFFSPIHRKFPLELEHLPFLLRKCAKNVLFRFLSYHWQQEYERGLEQFQVESCRDTGYRIYTKYRSKLKHETLSIFALDPRNFKTRLFESFLPDRFRTFPRKAAYIQKTGSPLFAEFVSHGEQFFWKDQLFGFHLKGVLDSLSIEEKEKMKDLLLNTIQHHISNFSKGQTR